MLRLRRRGSPDDGASLLSQAILAAALGTADSPSGLEASALLADLRAGGRRSGLCLPVLRSVWA